LPRICEDLSYVSRADGEPVVPATEHAAENTTMTSASEQQSRPWYGWAIFILVAIAGLFYVKWFPYYHRAFTAKRRTPLGNRS
jgi:hypothetical protein